MTCDLGPLIRAHVKATMSPFCMRMDFSKNCELVWEDVLTIQAATRHELDPAQRMIVAVGELGSVQVTPEVQRSGLGSPGWPGGMHETLLSDCYRPLHFHILTCSSHTFHLVALHLHVHVPLGLQKVESFLLWVYKIENNNVVSQVKVKTVSLLICSHYV